MAETGTSESAPGKEPEPTFYRTAWEFLAQLSQVERRFWSLVFLTGLLAGLGAVALLKILRAVQHLAWGADGQFLESVTAATPLRQALVPLLGGVLVSGVSLFWGHPLRGHGTAGILEAIWARAGEIPLLRTLLRATVSIFAVAMGAPLGREGALIQTGAATSSWLSQRLNLPPQQTRVLVACGASAGIAAAYNVPIGAALFGLEVLLGSFALDLFGPIVLACVVATLVSRVLIADHPSYVIPHYALSRPRDLALALVLGVMLGAASALYVKVIDFFEVAFEKVPRKLAPFMPTLAMGAVGLTAIRLPQILGNGYDVVNSALLGDLPLSLLIILPLAKLLATGVTAGAGVPGGLFTPSLFYGALLGGLWGAGWKAFSGDPVSVGAYALLGMGAILSGTTHAAVCAVLLIFELTGSYQIILPLMLACVMAAAISRRLQPTSLYTSVLLRRNVLLPDVARPRWMRTTNVESLVERTAKSVEPSAPFARVVVELLELPAGHDLYVADPRGRLLGSIVLHQLKGHLPDHSLLTMTVAADVMIPARPVQLAASLAEAAGEFANTSLERLPVVGPGNILLGTISKQRLLSFGLF